MLSEDCCKFPRSLNSYIYLFLVLISLPEVCLVHPSLCCCAVGHGEGAVSMIQAASNDVDPGSDDRSNEFEEVVRGSEV